MFIVNLRLFQKQRYSNKTKQFFHYDIVVRNVGTCWDFSSKIREKCELLFSCVISRLLKEVAVSSHSLSRGLFNVYWLIESKCLGEFSWISLLYRLGVLFTKRLLVRK